LPVITFTWHTALDERTCPFCAPLHNRNFVYHVTDEGSFPAQVVDSSLGVIWDLISNEPRTHGVYSRRGPWNCRCTLTAVITDADLDQAVSILLDDTDSLMRRWNKNIRTLDP
jgi:hypothetical protein